VIERPEDERRVFSGGFAMRLAHVEAHAAVRVGVAVLMLVPTAAVVGFHVVVGADLQAWLKDRAGGLARPDAFDGVNAIWPRFSTLLGITSLLAAYLVVSHKSRSLVVLAIGPCLATVAYLAANGITDPEWFTLLALLSIGMLVSSIVTVWATIRTGRRVRNS
jgi:hypothetical protein